MTIELAVYGTHAPPFLNEDQVPDYQKQLVTAFHQQRDKIKEVKPDVMVLISSHFLTNWNHYVDGTPEHKGFLTAREHPDTISNVPFDYPGDKELAFELAEAGKAVGIPVVAFDESTYIWDYGTLVPLRYWVPNGDLPVIDLSCNMSASLEETYRWGEEMGKVLRNSKKRVVFGSSGAMSHRLVRGRENMPTIAEKAMDERFIELLIADKYNEAWEMLPQFSWAADVESGGRHVAALLGVLGNDFNASYLGYAQSSGSGNPHLTFEPKQTCESN
jgi:3,4-dihydroxyphenylacetate 2,3-dioxygenase